MIVICNPNNPTGARLTAAELDAIARIADRHGAWILSDEVYRGAEIDGVETASMWGRSPNARSSRAACRKPTGCRACASAGLSAPPSLIASLWSYHDYVTIAPGALSDRLARVALQPERRARLFERTRGILRRNLPLIEAWLRDAGGFRWIRPEAGAIVYVRYDHPINSTTLVTRLREEKSVLIVPGDHFGMDGYLRLGFGEPPEYNRAGLDRLQRVARRRCRHRAPAPRRHARMNQPELTLVLIGFGNVARRFVRLLDETADRLDFTWKVVGIATRHHGSVVDPGRHRHARARSRPSKARQSLDRLDPAPRERSGIDVIRQVADALADDAAEGRLVVHRDDGARHRSRRAGRRRTCAPRSKARRTSSPPTRGRRRLRITSSRRSPNPSIACSSSKAR